MTTSGTGLYAALKQYKGRPTSISRRQQLRLADLLGTFFERHGRCVAPDGYDAVVVVPSGQVRGDHHPLASTLRMLPEVGHAVVDALRRGRATIERNTPARDAYRCRRELVEERRVLLVDDTYTTGAHLHSAAAALEGRADTRGPAPRRGAAPELGVGACQAAARVVDSCGEPLVAAVLHPLSRCSVSHRGRCSE